MDNWYAVDGVVVPKDFETFVQSLKGHGFRVNDATGEIYSHDAFFTGFVINYVNWEINGYERPFYQHGYGGIHDMVSFIIEHENEIDHMDVIYECVGEWIINRIVKSSIGEERVEKVASIETLVPLEMVNKVESLLNMYVSTVIDKVVEMLSEKQGQER